MSAHHALIAGTTALGLGCEVAQFMRGYTSSARREAGIVSGPRRNRSGFALASWPNGHPTATA